MIEVFKIITHNIYDPDVPLYLNWNITRTVAIEVININLNHAFHYNLRKNYFFLHASLIFGRAYHYQTMLLMLILLTSLKRA